MKIAPLLAVATVGCAGPGGSSPQPPTSTDQLLGVWVQTHPPSDETHHEYDFGALQPTSPSDPTLVRPYTEITVPVNGIENDAFGTWELVSGSLVLDFEGTATTNAVQVQGRTAWIDGAQYDEHGQSATSVKAGCPTPSDLAARTTGPDPQGTVLSHTDLPTNPSACSTAQNFGQGLQPGQDWRFSDQPGGIINVPVIAQEVSCPDNQGGCLTSVSFQASATGCTYVWSFRYCAYTDVGVCCENITAQVVTPPTQPDAGTP